MFYVVSQLVRNAVRVALAAWLTVLITGSSWADDYGKGVSAFRNGDYGYSVSLLKPLAQAGDPFAQFALAVMYDDGLGLPQNFVRALHWYRKAAHSGLVDSQYMVARFYGRGRGVKQDPATAFFWFNIAAAGGHPYAARLRDQHIHQITVAQREKLEARAVEWHERHPAQFTCKSRTCIHPSWTKRPKWRLFY